MFFNSKNKEIALKTPGYGVDFHMHTQASDGAWTPETLVEVANAQGIRLFAVSDHDVTGSVRQTQAIAARHGIEVIPGVEITVNWKNQIYHLLSLNFDLDNPELNALLADTRAQETARKDEIIAGLKKSGFKLDKLDAMKRPDGHFLATDIVRALHKGGEVRSFEEGYRRAVQFGLERICSQPADAAISTVVKAGGVPVLAHPGRAEYGFSAATPQVLREFMEFGLAGVEAYHYSHDETTTEWLKTFAQKNGLAISAGSDSHGEARKPMPWNPEIVAGLLERLNKKPTRDYQERIAG
jgi:3',5'-nucleoside bisphosphate phosphatase